ncbi:MAG: metal-dependent hydrolase [Haloferacaceae archaeon]
MFPWGHAAVGYLAYRGLRAARGRDAPTPAAALGVAVGSQAPDLIDKPLAWTLGVLPAGRALGHSLLVAALAGALLARVGAVRARPAAATGFAVGALSHALADAAGPALAGRPAAASFLLWPALPLRIEDDGHAILGMLRSVEPTPDVLVGLALTAAAAAVWVRDGAPGAGFVTRRLPGRGRTE